MRADDMRSADEMAGKFSNGASVEGAKRRGNGEGKPTPLSGQLEFVHASKIGVTAPDWLVRNLVECGTFGVPFGDSETGKSLFAIDMGLCIAAGVPFHGYAVKQGPVLYLAGEGQRGLGRRLRAWELHNGLSLVDIPFYVSTVATSLTDERSQLWLRDRIDRFAEVNGNPVLIIIDTLARNFGAGDENSTRDMGIAVSACDFLREHTGAAIMVPHHSGHGDKTRARGAVALRAAADFEFSFALAEDGSIAVACTKAKDSARLTPQAFRVHTVELDVHEDDGTPVTSVVLVPTTYVAPVKRTSAGIGKNQRKALRILVERYEKNRANVVASGRDASEALVAMDTWRDLCVADGIDRWRFREVSASLQTIGKVKINYGNVTLCETCETSANRTDSHDGEPS